MSSPVNESARGGAAFVWLVGLVDEVLVVDPVEVVDTVAVEDVLLVVDDFAPSVELLVVDIVAPGDELVAVLAVAPGVLEVLVPVPETPDELVYLKAGRVLVPEAT
jgi:hypothetical protein